MPLNIKNREAEELAHRLADATGESLTGAITTALRERLSRVEASAQTRANERADRLRAVAADAAGRWAEPYRSANHGELLYDEAGLPK